jgi:sulfur carrier protein
VNAAPSKVGIFVNDQPQELAGPATLLAVLAGLGLAECRGVAAAVNGEVVSRGSWETRALEDRDRIVVIRATQGG